MSKESAQRANHFPIDFTSTITRADSSEWRHFPWQMISWQAKSLNCDLMGRKGEKRAEKERKAQQFSQLQEKSYATKPTISEITKDVAATWAFASQHIPMGWSHRAFWHQRAHSASLSGRDGTTRVKCNIFVSYVIYNSSEVQHLKISDAEIESG